MKNFIFIVSLCMSVLINTTSHSMEYKKIVYQNPALKNRMTAYQEEFKLHSAVCTKDFKTVVNMLKNNANINEQDHNGRTPLFAAAYIGNIQMVSLLLQHGAIHTADYRHNSPFDIATERNHTDVALLLQWHWVKCISDLL